MNCAPDELKDYLLGELDEAGRARVRSHLAACASCREELERLKLTRAALLALREEEVPRRIAFVSDPVLERGWWRRLWAPSPRWAFTSALVVALAIVAHGWIQRRPAPVAHTADAAAIEQRLRAEFRRELEAAVREAVARVEAAQQERVRKAVAEAQREWEFQRKADMLAVEENFNVLKKRMNVLQIYLASNLEGARP
ncbi:MAG: zf-HC2 domain-containing protein [Bryobacterales bacterium]|nr:zf-HC2 domain-containing protein [Bryobacteraceae bacterium]MDW8131198.1 zf-HC2 domain-containing protein [Bryobacterales bacterium]